MVSVTSYTKAAIDAKFADIPAPGGSDADVADRITSGALTKAAGDARWQRDLQIITAKQHNVPEGGITDASSAFQTMCNAVPTAGGEIHLTPGATYLVRSVRPKSNTKIVGHGATLLYKSSGSSVYEASLAWGDLAATGGTTTASNLRNIHIEGVIFRGTGDTVGLSENQAMIHFSGVSDAVVRDCVFLGMQGDGVYIGCTSSAATQRHNERITIEKCTFDGLGNYGRQAVSVIEGTDITIQNNQCQNMTHATMPGAIDIETNPLNTWALLRNIKVRGNTFRNIGGNVGHVALAMPTVTLDNPIQGIVFEDNYHYSAGRPYFIGGPSGIGLAVEPSAIVVRGNYARCSSGSSTVAQVQNIRGVRIENNFFVGYALSAFLLALVVDIDIVDNELIEIGTSTWTGIECVGTVVGIDVSRNRVVNRTGHTIDQLILISNASVTDVRAFNNNTVGVTSLAALSGTGSTVAVDNHADNNSGPAVPPTVFAPPTPPEIFGSRNGNTALGLLLTALETSNIINDSTYAVALPATKTADYALDIYDELVLFSGASLTATLPEPSTVVGGRRFMIKNMNSTSLTIVSAGTSKTIDGAASKTLIQWATISVVSDGTNWLTI